MSYSLQFEPRSTYVYITVTGENSVDSKNGYLAEVHAWCLQHKYPNVLIVENLSGPGLGTYNIFELVSRKSTGASQVLGRLAYVDINPEHDPKAMEFAEDVAVNRGIPVRIFATVREAEMWLESQARI